MTLVGKQAARTRPKNGEEPFAADEELHMRETTRRPQCVWFDEHGRNLYCADMRGPVGRALLCGSLRYADRFGITLTLCRGSVVTHQVSRPAVTYCADPHDGI